MERPSATAARRAAIWLLWLLALWNSWECRALFSDGAQFLVDVVARGSFHSYNALARQYSIGLTQIPLVMGLWLGITDLHWLARLFSLGAFAVPTALYHYALVRAKDDSVLLSLVVAALAAVFMTTSFFIVGEFHTAYALAIATAVHLASSQRPSLRDGIVLVILAVVALRTYESMLGLGPLLAAMTLWRTFRWSPQVTVVRGDSITGRLLLMGLPTAAVAVAFLGPYAALIVFASVLLIVLAAGRLWPQRGPMLAAALHYLAAALFLAIAPVAIDSIARGGGASELAYVASSSLPFWRNLPFDLVIAALVILALGALAKSDALTQRRLYVGAAVPLVLLALSPLLSWSAVLAPFGTQHFAARTAAGVVVIATIGLIWARAAGWSPLAPRLPAFCFALLLAALPAQIVMTTDWMSAVSALRATLKARTTGPLQLADLPEPIRRLYWLAEDAPLLQELSLVLRPNAGAATVVVHQQGVAIPNAPMRDPADRYVWRD